MTTTFYPSFRYRDPDAAIAWLGEAFGLVPGSVHRDDTGRIVHANLWLGDAAVMLGHGEPDVKANGTYAAVDDLDALWEQARAAGATIERELQDTDYGSREFAARDPEGHIWYFGTYRPSPPTPA